MAFIIINCFIERNSRNITFCSKRWNGFRSRSPRHYYGKEERPNTGLAEISLLPLQKVTIIRQLITKKRVSIVNNIETFKQYLFFTPYLFNFSNVSNLSDNIISLSDKFVITSSFILSFSLITWGAEKVPPH